MIVDVPARQVNRPFEYQVPAALVSLIQVGMRVVVPFRNRSVQGFVVECTKQKTFDGEVQAIERLMDVEPVLTPEMLALGAYMAKQFFAFLVQCYQTMLPTMLKGQQQKWFRLQKPQEHPDIHERLFRHQATLAMSEQLTQEEVAELLRLSKSGIVSIETQVYDRTTLKYEEWLVLTHVGEWYLQAEEQLSKRAYKKRALAQTLAKMSETAIPKKTFLKQFSFSQADVRFAQEAGWLTIEKKQVNRDPYAHRTFIPSQPLVLNEEQQVAYQTVLQQHQQSQQSHVYLLEGVTGSGKTEVYLQWIAQAMQQGKTAMMLVPEIALTPQMVERFKARFGNRVAVLHSGLSAGEKYDEWRKIKEKKADIVVGARSSVFAPLDNIGMIILDEEHESSYKQEEAPRYHAREIAIWRGAYHGCPVILGSATPSLESRARAQKGVYTLLRLTQRANKQALPTVRLIDMRQEFATQKGNFSKPLLQALEDRLAKGEQSVLLLNRRGYSSFMMCRDCGHVVECQNCDISLTLHMDTKTMKCHYCGYEEAIPQRCPRCQSRQIRYYGTGTQKIQEEVQQFLPTARVIRMDIDTTRRKGQHEALLKQFERQEADILIGTQMIAKGLDYPNVTLVGVLNADTALNIPDFRSSEKTFQLLTQVAGRAGRGNRAGEVFIQTYNPTHYAIVAAQRQQYEAFFVQEMHMRHRAQYPPYYFTVMITTSSEEEVLAQKQAWAIRRFLETKRSPKTILLGPSAKSIARVNNRYYYQLLIKYQKEPHLNALLEELLMTTQTASGRKVSVTIDVEPQYFL